MRANTGKPRKPRNKSYITPEFQEAARQRSRELWTDPEYRKNQAKQIYPVQPDDVVKLPPETLKPEK